MENRQKKHIIFGSHKDYMPAPHFLDYQRQSYEDFIQRYSKPANRENKGLERVFREFFPIISSYGNLKLEYVSYKLEESNFPLNDIEECRKRSKTYSTLLKIKLRIVNNEGEKIQEGWVTVSDIPLMTDQGTFIINGTERVVVIQLHRSPGVFFSKETNSQSGKDMFNARIVPYKGAWLEIENTKEDVIIFKVDRKKKVPFNIFVRALGLWKNNLELLQDFFDRKKVKISSNKDLESLEGTFVAEDIVNSTTGEIIKEAATYLDIELLNEIESMGVKEIEVFAPKPEEQVLVNTLLEDAPTEDAAIELFKKLRPHDIATLQGAKSFINRSFFDSDRYNLGDVGRYKINTRLGLDVDISTSHLTKEDVVAMVKYIFKLQKNEGRYDDINSLSNRRIRGVGELMSLQFKSGLNRIERHAKEKMAMNDPYTTSIQSILNTKFLYSVVMEFFATGQLSQFMDQTNPLSEMTHKRRVSSLGKGGISRERATFDVRDVHSSHYGRLCTVETPEGPNIGITGSLASYARVNKYGFIETPYARVENGKVLKDKIDYLSYDDEANYFIAQFGTKTDNTGNILEDEVLCRYAADDEILKVPKSQVNYIDVSSKQTVSVSTSLIPFLEHTDANRALTGSNMQRQAVPLLRVEPARVTTGVEKQVAEDSYAVIKAKSDGEVKYVDAEKIIVHTSKGLEEYKLMNFTRSNHGMSMTNKPLVSMGQRIKAGDIIADGPSTYNGEMAIGKNVLIAYMPWRGYNFEDAILISERLAKDDVFTSAHVECYDVEVRATKLGDEEITREVPNITERAASNLDERGIVRIGSEVSSGSILVGKITPKSDVDPAAEEKLLRAVFGQKARDVKDTSLRLSHGAKGIVVDVVELSRENGDDLPAGVNNVIKVYIAEKRKITVGDKMCGRHGNKGIVSRILPVEDMPFLPDGTPIDIVLNPLGIPSRMNIGQVLEAHLGFAANELDLYMTTPVFDGAKEGEIKNYLKKAGIPEDGKMVLHDGLTGEPFENRVNVGYIYMLKLHHLIEDKMHARSIGPYSLVTQQPLGGKAQFGGQRLGEMEVWALEAHGVSSILREMLTIKSDDISGRTKAYESIVKGGPMPEPGAPESFKVLVREFNSLGMNVDIYDEKKEIIPIDSEAELFYKKNKLEKENNENEENS